MNTNTASLSFCERLSMIEEKLRFDRIDLCSLLSIPLDHYEGLRVGTTKPDSDTYELVATVLNKILFMRYSGCDTWQISREFSRLMLESSGARIEWLRCQKLNVSQ